MVLLLMVIAGSPATLRPLSAQAEEIELEETVCTSEVTPCCLRVRRLIATLCVTRFGCTQQAVADCAMTFRDRSFSIARRGHTLANGLNAPLLI